MPHPQGPRRIVTVDGGIGSGKSSVTRVSASLDAVTADAGTIARETLEPGEPALSEITRAFGGDLLRQDGNLDRALLASRVFGGEGTDGRVARLSAITHPLIEARTWSILHGAPEGGLAIYGIPLLIEGDHVDRFDTVVIMDAPIEEHVKHLGGRGSAPEDAHVRIHAQASSQEHHAIATIWIDNEDSSDDLEEIARLVYERWLTPGAPLTVRRSWGDYARHEPVRLMRAGDLPGW